jgi:hypothetical protein
VWWDCEIVYSKLFHEGNWICGRRSGLFGGMEECEEDECAQDGPVLVDR